MVYLEYDLLTKQVIQIHETEPIVVQGNGITRSDEFVVGDEFESTIWIHGVDEVNNLSGYSAIRNNPNAKRLLQENASLITKTLQQSEQIAEQNQRIYGLTEQDTQIYELLIERGLI